jgi:glycine betaine transporter
MKLNPLLITALLITGAIAAWGLIDTAGLAKIASDTIKVQFSSRAWFIMLTVSGLLITSIVLATSRWASNPL